MKKLEVGLIHIYTGDGKGKTTAALGQGTRTAGGGYKVLMTQFLKGDDTGELNSIEAMPNFEIKRFAGIKNFYRNLSEEGRQKVKEEAQEAVTFIQKALQEESHNLIIMDEIMAVLSLGILQLEEVINLLKSKPNHIEMILTGRNAPPELVEIADYVTEMKMIKHPYQKGVFARKGIES